MEKNGRGEGVISLEEGLASDKPIILLIFRNKFGSVMFQGQLMKNVSKLLKPLPPKPHKIRRLLSVISKKEDGKAAVIKCGITVCFVKMLIFIVQDRARL